MPADKQRFKRLFVPAAQKSKHSCCPLHESLVQTQSTVKVYSRPCAFITNALPIPSLFEICVPRTV